MTLLLARERHLLLVSGLLFTLLATLWAAPPEIYPVSALLAMLLLALLGGLLLRSGWLPSRNDLRFLACLGFPLLLSHVLAVNHGGSVESLVRILGTLLLFAVARELPWRVAAAVLILLVAGGTVLALHGLWQYFFGFDLILDAGSLAPAAAQRLGTYRVFSRFLLPSVLASFLILALPVAGGLVMHSSQGLHRIFACLAAAAMGAALLLTGSHGALLAILAAGLLAWRPLRGRRLGLAAGVLMATVTGLVLVFFLRGGVLLAGVEGEGPAALRWRNNVAASRMLVDHPLAGVGGGILK
ncbi:MAG: hypothetical protein ACE5ID_06820, partial [Acidobacteriota bacterium]